MKNIILAVTVLALTGINSHNVLADESRNVIQVNSDITVSCFFTVNQLQNNESYVYRIVSSSPRDCGAVDEKTGRLLETKVSLYCPRGYESVGIPRGGPIGSHGAEIFYQAQGMCRAIYYLPLNSLQQGVVTP
jgi:hypothetical protein